MINITLILQIHRLPHLSIIQVIFLNFLSSKLNFQRIRYTFYALKLNKGNTLKATEVKESFKIYNQIEDLIKTKELFIEFEVKSRMDINLNVRKGVPVKSIEKLTGTINRFGTTSLLDNYKLKYADYKMVGSIDKTFFDFTVDDCAKGNIVRKMIIFFNI